MWYKINREKKKNAAAVTTHSSAAAPCWTIFLGELSFRISHPVAAHRKSQRLKKRIQERDGDHEVIKLGHPYRLSGPLLRCCPVLPMKMRCSQSGPTVASSDPRLRGSVSAKPRARGSESSSVASYDHCQSGPAGYGNATYF